ncbi:unnamed protein product [Brassica napus]|uniref:(rape) hypothetical protein n=1 Tax=Brassica napus TaxID=3708 RepID=A0A816IZ77_BRANA|nr:unnamed protein product [Brassica napus]
MVSVSRYITMEALEQSLKDINGGRDINEIISEVDGEKCSSAASRWHFQLHTFYTWDANK